MTPTPPTFAWVNWAPGCPMAAASAWWALPMRCGNARARALYDRVARHQGFIRYDHPMTPPR